MNIKLSIILFFTLAVGLLSCKNKDLPPPVIAKANVSLVNATSDTLNFFVNNSRQNNFSPIFSGGAYGLYLASGTQNYQVKKDVSPAVLFSGTYTLSDISKVHYYSLFIGTSVDQTFSKINSLDSANAMLDSDKTNTTAMIRFVHASANSGALDVTIDKGDTVNIKNVAYKYSSVYFRVTGGVRTVKVYTHGSATPFLQTTLTLEQGSVYTFFAKGTIGGTGNNAFSVNLMVDNFLTTQ